MWLQRRKAANLLEVTRRFDSFPIMLETYREVLQDHFDMPALIEVLTDIQKRDVHLAEVDLDHPSPFARSLMFDFIASFMYEYDAPLAEKRAAALALDRTLLADLLGEPEFREILDADAVESVEADLQHLSDDRKISTLDGVADLLRDVGPLDVHGISARSVLPKHTTTWLDELILTGRVFRNHSGGRDSYIAVEDASRLRDTIGIQPPPGIASEFLEPALDPLGDIVGRYARTHGPFTAREAAADTGLSASVVMEVLTRLESEGKVSSGAYRPGGTEHEWVSTAVLTRLRRRSLAVLRQQVEAVDIARFAGFLPAWQGVNGQANTPFDEVVRQLKGAVVPASDVESLILSTRVANASIELDRSLASGALVWIGVEPLGSRDGKIVLFPREEVPLLLRASTEDPPDTQLHSGIVESLSAGGASFFSDIYANIGGDPSELIDALWDLVWSGVVTNDSFAPLRAFTHRRARRASPRSKVSLSQPHAAGRWFLVDQLRRITPTSEERGLATAHMLLDRYGVVTRDSVLAEGLPGGFSGLYPVLASLEDIGVTRRGYFVESLGGAQFGSPGAIERLRASESSDFILMAATDPANAYGASLRWPESKGVPQRRAKATVVLASGHPVAWLDPAGRSIALFGSSDSKAVEAIWMLADARHRSVITRIDGVDVHTHPLTKPLEDRGFTAGYKGYTIGRSRPSTDSR